MSRRPNRQSIATPMPMLIIAATNLMPPSLAYQTARLTTSASPSSTRVLSQEVSLIALQLRPDGRRHQALGCDRAPVARRRQDARPHALGHAADGALDDDALLLLGEAGEGRRRHDA